MRPVDGEAIGGKVGEKRRGGEIWYTRARVYGTTRDSTYRGG